MKTDRPALARLRREMRALSNAERAAVSRRYFKTGPGEYGEGDRFLGLTVPAQHKLARAYRDLARADVLRLLRSPIHEHRLTALLILVSQFERGTESERQEIHALYLENTRFVNNWDLVDASAPPLVGKHLLQRKRALLDRLARSPLLWERRIAILATLTFIRNDEYDDTLRIVEHLLADEHDLLHKAVGWMLREVAHRDRALVERFLDRHVGAMPRTMLRYAIEKFPERRRQRYLKRGRGGS
jgi:3-methyladenine DNA glycosylase AlkD